MGKHVPLEIVFLNRPDPERVFRTWAEIECAIEMRHEALAIEKREKNERSA